MKSPLSPRLLLAASLALFGVAATSSAAPNPKAPNPVQHEMQLLQTAMQDAVAAIANGDVRGLPKKLHAVHLASGDTKKKVKSGAYRLPHNAERVDEFIALDDAFHTEMIQMVKAAKKNDVATTAQHFGGLMNRCNACHAVFKAPAKAK